MRNKVIMISILLLMTMCYAIISAPISDLYSDHRAMRVNDILTVIIVENAKAGSESQTNTKKENGIGANTSGLSGGPLGWIPGLGGEVETSVGYDGKGGTKREGSLVAKISTRVVEVMDNGNLIIEGSKVVEINEEKEIIKISGSVRPEDIQPDNSVYSHSIADAQITYTGQGVASTGRRPGFLARFFNWIF